jgi:hypothetical protein
MQTLPIVKQLSYIFARATGEDVFCSRLYCDQSMIAVRDEFDRDTIAYYTKKRSFKWIEASPAPGEDDSYIVSLCNYSRTESPTCSANRAFYRAPFSTNTEKPYFTRTEAIRFVWQFERMLRVHYEFIPEQPAALRGVSIHKLRADPEPVV